MRRALSLLMTVPLLCVALEATGHAADEDSKFAGLWQENQDGSKVTWLIGYWNGKWSVSATLNKDGKRAGSWQGTDVRVADGKLTFTRKRGDDAPESVADGDRVTVTLKDVELSYSADKGGMGSLKRSTEVALAPDALPPGNGPITVADAGKNPPIPNPNPDNPNPGKPPRRKRPPLNPGDKPQDKNPPTPPRPGDKPAKAVVVKPPEDAKKYAGMWLSDREADGYRSVWTLKIGEDKATVSITNFDPKGKKVSCYITGDKVHFEDSKLVFNQKMSPNCPRHWFRNVQTTLEFDRDSLAMTCFGSNATLTRLSATAIESGYVGGWIGEFNGLREEVKIQKSSRGWRVAANLMRGNQKVSSWVGQDIKLEDNKLTFMQKFAANAPASWPDKSRVTLEWDGDPFTLSFNWVNGDKTGDPRPLKLASK